MSTSYQRRNNPLKWIQGFYPRTYSYPIYGGNRDQISAITPIRHIRFQSVVPRYRLLMPDTRDKRVGSIFGEPTTSHASMARLTAEANQANGIVPRKLSEEKKPGREVGRKTTARNTTRLVRMGKFEVVNDIGFEPPMLVDENA